jgi:hypothetical protein
MMLGELDRRNYSQPTRRAYLFRVEQFARHFHRSPEQLGLDRVRDYQVYLLCVRNLRPNTVAVRLATLRFGSSPCLNHSRNANRQRVN